MKLLRPWLMGVVAALLCAQVGAILPVADRAFENVQAEWLFHLKQVEGELGAAAPDWRQLEAIRPQLSKLAQIAREFAHGREAEVNDLRSLVETLGSEPGPDESAEEPEVARERLRIEQQIAELDGQRKHAELTLVRVKALQDDIAQGLRELLAFRLTSRDDSPLAPKRLRELVPALHALIAQAADKPAADWTRLSADPDILKRISAMLLWFLIIAVLTRWMQRWALRRARRQSEVENPTVGQRVFAAMAVFLSRGLLPATPFMFILFRVLDYPGEPGFVGSAVVGACAGCGFAFAVYGLARAALAPVSAGQWRLADLRDQSALPLFRRIMALAILIAIVGAGIYPLERHFEIPVFVSAFFDLLYKMLFATYAYSMLHTRLWRPSGPRPEKKKVWVAARRSARLLAVAAPIAAMVGYRHLSDYIVLNMVVGFLVFGIAAAVRGLAHDLIVMLVESGGAEEQAASEVDSGQAAGSGILKFWLSFWVDVLVVVTVGILLLPGLGVDWQEVKAGVVQAFVGYKVGGYSLSVGEVLVAVVGFVGIIVASRWLQRLLESHVLPRTGLHTGIGTAILTAVGYLGIVAAVIFAFAALGLDFTKLALVAGALSLGLGFGLQNVVNNFVSGLILLAERPVKVGDWVVLGENSGIVRQIKVRATEIETFHRASIFVPNSTLLSSALVNWTHKSPVARVEVRVGVAYGTDTRRVRTILLDCAAQADALLKSPPPYVLFEHFGDDALEFELHGFVRDAGLRTWVASELRFAVDKAFRQHGIEIPFPQRVIHKAADHGGGS